MEPPPTDDGDDDLAGAPADTPADARTEAPRWYAMLLASAFMLLFSAYGVFQVPAARAHVLAWPSLSRSHLVGPGRPEPAVLGD
jgi:hypothetical protein